MGGHCPGLTFSPVFLYFFQVQVGAFWVGIF
jgi:hypothetical protein